MKKTRIFAFVLAVVMIFSVISVCASAAYTPKTKAEVAALEGVTVRLNLDLTTQSASGIQDGNSNDTKVTLYDGVDGAAGTVLTTSSGAFTLINNVSRTPANDPLTNTNAFLVEAYKASDDAILFGDEKTVIVDKQEFWVVKNGEKYSVAEEGTAGAIKAVATRINDDNNCFTAYNSTAISLVNNVFVTSMDFRHTGISGVNLVMPCFRYNGTNTSYGLGYLSGNTLSIDGKEVAYVSSDRYHNVTTAYYVAETGENVYSAMADIYLDGIKIYTGFAFNNLRNVAASVFETNGMSYIFHAYTVRNYNTGEDALGTMKPSLYVRSVQEYYVPTANAASAFNYFNNADTVNGYDLTINNGVLGLNYYLNLTGDVLADENAKVVFTTPRGEVQEKLIKDVTAETNGSYKFTATVSAVEMAEDITMQIVSGEKVYKIYKDGVAAESAGYNIKTYAEAVIASTLPAVTAEHKTLAKAMLNYGAYAQIYFAAKNGTEAGTLANANCAYTTELNGVTIDVTDPTQTGTGKKVAKLILDTTTSIVIYDENGNKIGEQKEINSKNLDYAYEIDCGAAGKVTVSVLAVGEKVLASGTATAEYKNLIKALKLFSDASEALA